VAKLGITASPEDLDLIRKIFIKGYHADISSGVGRKTFKKEIENKLRREPNFLVRDILKNLAMLAHRGHAETFEIGLGPDASLFLHFALTMVLPLPTDLVHDLENVKEILRESLSNREAKSRVDVLKKVTVDSIEGVGWLAPDSSLVVWDAGFSRGTHFASVLSFNNPMFHNTARYLFESYAKKLHKVLRRLPAGRPADYASTIQPISNLQLGETLFYLKRFEEAENELRKTLEQNPKAKGAYLNLGRVLYGRGRSLEDLKNAEMHLREEARIDPLNPEVFYWLGHVLLSEGRYEEAYKEFMRALQISPAYKPAEFFLTVAHAEAKKSSMSICPMCKGSGKTGIFGRRCDMCNGTGRVTKG
jgi:tetratricopeptide (TPR) repeat protein